MAVKEEMPSPLVTADVGFAFTAVCRASVSVNVSVLYCCLRAAKLLSSETGASAQQYHLIELTDGHR